jgi:hypothetical protein
MTVKRAPPPAIRKAPPKTREQAEQEYQDPEVQATILRTSLAVYASETLTGPRKAPYNGKFLIGKPHITWSKLLRSTKRLCILAPRDHGKTYFFNFAYPIWMADTRPGSKGYIFSATKDQAVEKLEAIAHEIENNPELAHLDASEIPGHTWSKTKLELKNGSVIYARGFGTKVRGAHPDWIVCDDVLNDEDATSLTIRRRNIKYFRSAISNLAGTDATIIIIGTPFHQADLYAKLRDNPEYVFRSYPAEDKTGKPLWEERYNRAQLAAKKREIGSVEYTREFLLKPVSDDTSLFPDELFEGPPFEQMHIKLGMPWEYWDRLGVTIYQGVDFAISASSGADYFVIWTVGVDDSGNRWIINIERHQGAKYKKQKSRINAQGQKYQPALIILEDNQMQAIYGQELMEETDLPIVTYTTGVEKHSLAKGVPALRTLLENKKYRCPRGDQESVEMTDVWIDELHNISVVDGKVISVGEHDDTVMASWLGEKAIEKGRAFGFSFGEEKGDKEAAAEMEALDIAEQKREEVGKERERAKNANQEEEEGSFFDDGDDYAAEGVVLGAPSPSDLLGGF